MNHQHNPYEPRRHTYVPHSEAAYPELRQQDLAYHAVHPYQPIASHNYAAHGQPYAPAHNQYVPPQYPPLAPLQVHPEQVPLLPPQQIVINDDEEAVVDRKAEIRERIKELGSQVMGGCSYCYYLMLYFLIFANFVLLFVRVRRGHGYRRFIIPVFFCLLALVQGVKGIRGMKNLSLRRMNSAMRVGCVYMFLTLTFAVYLYGQSQLAAMKEDLCFAEKDGSSTTSHSSYYSECEKHWFRSRMFRRQAIISLVVVALSGLFYLIFANCVRRRLATIHELKKKLHN